ncbi:MAG: winged helix-turn-helix domain-containing protein [Pseudomonadales bacterium]|nr:winged helix-turn-helix domain-containing protein [Pseudomonadales bacterium]
MANEREPLPAILLDSREGILTGPAGKVRIEPRVMEVLLVLAGRAGEVISRDELLDAVWPGVIVTEHTISRCIYQLRHRMRDIIGDENLSPIETIPKRGYRLWAEVKVTGSDDDAAHALSTTRPNDADDKSIAVLPFEDMSRDGDQQYFGDGIAEELISGLTKIKGLRVIARTSSFQFKGSNDDITSIGQKLNVATVLEGSVRRAGNRIRLTAQLIDVRTNSHLWSEQYDRELGDIFDVQDDVARRVINALSVELGSGQQQKVIDVGTTQIEAYNAYLLALNALRQVTLKSLTLSTTYLQQALEQDPDFTAAHGLLAICYVSLMTSFGVPWSEMGPKARATLERAKELNWQHPILGLLQIDPRLQANAIFDQRKMADKVCERFRHPDPSWQDFEYMEMSMLLHVVGLTDAALDYFDLYCSKVNYVVGETLIPGLASHQIAMLFARHRYREAIEVASAQLEIEPERHLIRAQRAVIFCRDKQFSRAQDDLAIISRVWPRAFAQVVHLYWKGDKEKAEEEFLWMAGRASFQGVLRVNGYFMFNEVDKALDCLEQLVESNDPSAHYIRVQLRHYCPQEIIDEVESHPRYRQLLTRLQVHDSWQEELVQKANDIADITGIQVNRPKAW